MSFPSLSRAPIQEETKQLPYDKKPYEITFLTTICLVYLNQENKDNLSQVD